MPRFTATSLVFFSFPSPFLCHRSLVNYVSPAGSRLSRRRQMIIYGSINSFDRSLEISSRDPWIAARGSKNTAFFSFFFFSCFFFQTSRHGFLSAGPILAAKLRAYYARDKGCNGTGGIITMRVLLFSPVRGETSRVKFRRDAKTTPTIRITRLFRV